jgi:hypothetical protein
LLAALDVAALDGCDALQALGDDVLGARPRSAMSAAATVAGRNDNPTWSR